MNGKLGGAAGGGGGRGLSWAQRWGTLWTVFCLVNSEREAFALTPKANLELPVQLTSMPLGWKRTNTGTGQTCKLHTEDVVDLLDTQ